MSDGNGQGVPMHITIVVTPEGGIQLKTNIQSLALACGLIDMAKNMLLNPKATEKSPIQIPSRAGL